MRTLDVVAIHHVCIVVRDRQAADRFYTGILGLQPHPKVKSWLILNGASTLHLLTLPDEDRRNSLSIPRIQHFALQVTRLRDVLALLISAGELPFQMDVGMNEHVVTTADDPLSFGTETLFVRDPDGNLIEFVEQGKGLLFSRL